MRPILLVPIDLPILGNHILDYATKFSKTLRIPMVLLHTHFYKIPALAQPIEKFKAEFEEFIAEKEQNLKHLSNKIEEKTRVSCSYILQKGYAPDVIVDTAKELRPELLIMGSEDLSFFERILFNSTSLEVFKKTKEKLMIIPDNAAFTSLKNIAYATNFHDGDFENIQYLIKLLDNKDSILHLVHVIDYDINTAIEHYEIDNYEIKVKNMFPNLTCKTHLLEGTNIAKEVLRFTNDNKMDLLAVAKTDRSPIEDFFGENVSKKLFKETRVPLLVLKYI